MVIPALDGLDVSEPRLIGQKRGLVDDIRNGDAFSELAFAVAAEDPELMYHFKWSASKSNKTPDCYVISYEAKIRLCEYVTF